MKNLVLPPDHAATPGPIGFALQLFPAGCFKVFGGSMMQPKKQVAVHFSETDNSTDKATRKATAKINDFLKGNPGAAVVSTSLATIEREGLGARADLIVVFELPS